MADTFNPGQRSVLESEAARIVVTAGAGSGKTRVLAERFADQVLRRADQGDPDPMASVLLITFTDKAAGELVERVRGTLLARGRADLARAVDDAWISTIHGFCGRVVRRHALELGIDPGFGVLGETEAGIAATTSFERAAASLVGDAGIRKLLDSWRIADLRASILGGHATMRSKGADIESVVAADPGDLVGALEGALRVLDDALPAYRDLPATATIVGNLAIYETARNVIRDALPALRSGDGRASDEGRELVGGVLRGKGARTGSAAMKELTEVINDALAAGLQALRDADAARESSAWCSLLAAYDHEFEGAKRDLGALDFEDLQLYARRLWREHPEAVARYREQFAEVMIDEFQDTNRLQVEAIEPVIGERVCYVGDIQQSIYGFRDADVSLFREQVRLASSGDDGMVCRLTVNYRSHPGVLGAVNRMFGTTEMLGADFQNLEHELERPTTVVWPAGEPRVEVVVVDKTAAPKGEWRTVEAVAVASRLRGIVDEGRARAGDIVVLARAATTMGAYVAALEDAGFEVAAPAAGGFYATREVADMRSLLRVLADPLDAEGTIGLLAGGLGGLSDDALFLLTRPDAGTGAWDALGRAAGLGLTPSDECRAELVRETVERLRTVQGRIRLADVLLHAAAVLAPGGGGLEAPGAWENYRKVARLAGEHELTTPADPGGFLAYLAEREAYVKKEAVGGVAAEGSNAVRVMTVHAAKGLEFPVVALVDLGHASNDSFSQVILDERSGMLCAATRGPRDSDDKPGPGATAWQVAAQAARARNEEEDARILYVGCTRAEQVLLLAGSADPVKLGDGSTAIDRIWRATGGRGGADVSVSVIAPEPCEPDGECGAEERGVAATGSGAASRPVGTPASVARGESAPRGDLGVDDAPLAAARVTEPLPDAGPIAPPAEMSYTAFALHGSCAYRFFAERMLGVGSMATTRENDPLALGSALHGALELEARGERVDAGRLEALAHAGGLGPGEVGRLVTAVEAVRSSAAGPLLAEGDPEVDFALPVAGGVVRGSIDLLVRRGDLAIVLDYKTGRTWDAEGGRYAAQAEVYALAMLEAGFTRVQVRFLHVEAGCEEAVFDFGPQDAPRIRASLEESYARMSSGSFPRLGAFDERLCADCPVSGSLCPVVHPGGRPSQGSRAGSARRTS